MTRDQAKRLLENIEFVRAFAEGKTITTSVTNYVLTDPCFFNDPSVYAIAEPKPDRVKMVYYRDDEGTIYQAVEGSDEHRRMISCPEVYTQVEIENE